MSHFDNSILNELPEETMSVFLAWGAFWSEQITPGLMSLYFASIDASHIDPVAILQNLSESGLIAQVHDDSHPPVPVYYRLTDAAFAYVREQSNNEQHNRAVDACLKYIERYETPSPENFAALEPEIDNFTGATAFAISQKRYEDVEKFLLTLYEGTETESGILYYRGEYATALLQQLVDMEVSRNNRLNQGHYLGELGLAYANWQEHEQAILYYQQALAIRRSIGDISGAATDLGNLAIAYHNLGEHEQAIQHYQQALTIHRSMKKKREESLVLGGLGLIYAEMQNHQLALEYHQQALEISRSSGNKSGESIDLSNLGQVHESLGNYQRAIEYYQQAAAISGTIEDYFGEGIALDRLGTIFYELERYQDAVMHFEQALKALHRANMPYFIEQAEDHLADVRLKLD